MNLSYWEIKSWFTNVDFTIIGSGIVGLSAALQLRETYPSSKILVLEKGVLPNGASTKNAGFACFDSLSEIIDDLRYHTKEEVFDMISMRWKGLKLLRKNVGDTNLNYKSYGGFEIFYSNEEYETCRDHCQDINDFLKPIFKTEVFSFVKNTFGFKKVKEKISFNKFEGQIDTGKMMRTLLRKAYTENIFILNQAEVTRISDHNKVSIEINNRYTFNTDKVLIATNGFTKQFLDIDVKPARAQVLITKPIKDLEIKGTYHLDKGYYYFRNIDNRILLGGGRNLDFKAEETTTFGTTQLIQDKLDELLLEVILPDIPFEIEHRWSGIMGVGDQKNAIVKQVSNNIHCGVRLGGMGVAIGSLIGKQLADNIDS